MIYIMKLTQPFSRFSDLLFLPRPLVNRSFEKKHKILWEDPRDTHGAKISFTGEPFIILGRKLYDCQHGIDRKAGEKRKRKDAEEVRTILYFTCLFVIYSGTTSDSQA